MAMSPSIEVWMVESQPDAGYAWRHTLMGQKVIKECQRISQEGGGPQAMIDAFAKPRKGMSAPMHKFATGVVAACVWIELFPMRADVPPYMEMQSWYLR